MEGILSLELTLTTPGLLEPFPTGCRYADTADVGVGTILTESDGSNGPWIAARSTWSPQP